MTKDIFIKVPLVDQWRDTKDKKWAGQVCAICSLKMLLEHEGKLGKSTKVMDLVKEGLVLDGFIENVGWKHKIIVELAKKHGLKLNFQKKFFKTSPQKLEGLSKINRSIKAGKPVVVSVYHRLDLEKGGHLVIINGLKINDSQIMGYYIQEPDHKFRGNNYFLSKIEFIKGWRGGMIYP